MGTILDDIFADVAVGDEVRKGAALASYKQSLDEAHQATDSGKVWMTPPIQVGMDGNLSETRYGTLQKGLRPDLRANVVANITKSLTAEQAAALQSDMNMLAETYVGDLQKDWTPTNPVGGTGLTAYDLEAPAKRLVPRYTPLRNSIPRVKGQGNARKFKRITSVTNAGIPGGAAVSSPFFSSQSVTTAFGPVTLNRPKKISYTGDDQSVGYVELGFSDAVAYIAQFQGLGFDNVRQLSQTATLYSHLMGEERALLYARGATGNGYAGLVAAPGAVTTGTATTGGTIAAATYSVYVTAVTGFGESAPSTVASQVTTGATSTLTVTVGTEPVGAIYYNLYIGTTAGIGNAKFQGSFAGNTITLTSYNAAGAVATGVDTSFDANAYDGFLTVQSDPTKTGYLARVNGTLSTANPGDELDKAFATMFINNGADPDEVWTTGTIRKVLAQIMRQGGTTGYGPGYRTTLTTGDGNVIMGTAVSGIMNANTGKVVDLKTHRFMPIGSALIRSTSLPVEDSNIAAPVSAVNVQDYMAIDWPQIQMSYDLSTYQIGTVTHQAPAWSGLLVGITNS
jgi:hypothetical protein